MKIIQNEFAKELSKLFVKYNKTIQSDKAGIFITDHPNGTTFFIGVGETASEDYRDKLIIALNSDIPPSEDKKEEPSWNGNFTPSEIYKSENKKAGEEKKEIKPTIEGDIKEAEVTDVIISENTDKAGKMAQEYPNTIIWKGIEYSKVVKCDTCGCYPSIIIRTSFGSFCKEHARYV